MVERAFILPPHSQIGPITPEQRAQLVANSIVAGVYEKAIDRESAYERLKGHAEQPQPQASGQFPPHSESQPWYANLPSLGSLGLGGGGGRGDTLAQALAKSAARSIGSGLGRQIVRGVLGSLVGSGRR